jgi:hypothetical protein
MDKENVVPIRSGVLVPIKRNEITSLHEDRWKDKNGMLLSDAESRCKENT